VINRGKNNENEEYKNIGFGNAIDWYGVGASCECAERKFNNE
jgi:hypothetical protein